MRHNTANPVRINGRQAYAYTRDCIPFKNSNGQLYALWVSPCIYAVYSYGPHWPLFIYSTDTRLWYANEDKFSRTTTKHYSQAFPYSGHPVRARSCTWMKRAAREGIAFILLSECEEAQAEAA